MDRSLKLAILTELLHEPPSSDLRKLSKSSSGSKPRDRCKHDRCRRRPSRHSCGKKLKSPHFFYRQWEEFLKIPPHWSRSHRRSPSIHCHNSPGGSRKYLTFMQPVNAYFKTALDYQSYCLADQSHHYGDDVARHIFKMAMRPKVQLKSQMCNNFDTMTLFQDSCSLFKWCVTRREIMRARPCGYSTLFGRNPAVPSSTAEHAVWPHVDPAEY